MTPCPLAPRHARYPSPHRCAHRHTYISANGGGGWALIQLVMGSAPEGVWTVVQWGDGHGRWYDVEGWRGTLDEVQYQTWWVAPADFGDAPFPVVPSFLLEPAFWGYRCSESSP
ncbi:MAG: hypothetical protein IPL28_24925 [Chloroflexi bacterium]|nr:hypothetical protein [Chloroflexota bacterium]